MSVRRQSLIAAVLVALFVTPRVASAAWWDVIGEMSGPGPFKGVRVTCRSKLPWKGICSDGVGAAGKAIIEGNDSGDATTWFRLDGSYHWGDRTKERDSTNVNWWAVEATLETSEHWNAIFPGLQDRPGRPSDRGARIRLFSGFGGSMNLFHGSGFPSFGEPGLKATPVGILLQHIFGGDDTQKGYSRYNWGIEAEWNFRYLAVAPDKFRLEPVIGGFDGRGEWLEGYSIGLYYQF